MPARPTVWTHDLVERVFDLRRAGLSRREIAQHFGVPQHRITYVIFKYDLAPSRPQLTSRAFAETVDIVAFRHGVKPSDLVSRQRKAPIVRARQAAMHELRRQGYSLPQIGRRFGMDHTSVWWGCKAHEARRAKMSAVRPQEENVCGRLPANSSQGLAKHPRRVEAV